jgi:hypothetical protein
MYSNCQQELLLRYLDSGINDIKVIKEKLSFLSKESFINALKFLNNSQIIKIEGKNIILDKKIKQIITFLDESNFIEYYNYILSGNFYFNETKIYPRIYLDKIANEFKIDNKTIRFNNFLAHFLKKIYNDEFYIEVCRLHIQTRGKKENVKGNNSLF